MEKKTQGRRSALPGPVKKLFWAGRLAIGAAAFVPLFLFMVLFNFKVDCQGYFQGDQELRDVVELMLNGHDVVGAEQMCIRDRPPIQGSQQPEPHRQEGQQKKSRIHVPVPPAPLFFLF